MLGKTQRTNARSTKVSLPFPTLCERGHYEAEDSWNEGLGVCAKDRKVPASYLFDPAPEKERAVCPAEAERVRHGIFDFRFAGLVGDQVHAGSVGIGILQVDGGRQD